MRKKAQAIQKQNTGPHMLSRGGYEYLEHKLMDEKRKKKLEEAAQSESTDTMIDPLSPIRRHVKWKMARMKKTDQITSKAAKEITCMIISDYHLLVANFYDKCWMSKLNLFNLLTIGFLRRAGLTGKFCCPWMLGCIDCCHWATKAP